MAFPKNNTGRDVLVGAPSPIEQKQLDELCILTNVPTNNNNNNNNSNAETTTTEKK
jgi:hypothetical protein